MISPLIEWDHSAEWPVAFSSAQDRMLSGERKVSMSLDEVDSSYLKGHEIDSEILFPGAGYLVNEHFTTAMRIRPEPHSLNCICVVLLAVGFSVGNIRVGARQAVHEFIGRLRERSLS